MLNKTNKIMIAIAFALAIFAFSANQTNAQTLTPNDGTFEYIKILPDGLAIKLTDNALNFAWTDWGAKEIAQRTKWLGERANRVCYNINIDKLARQIRYHALAYKGRVMRGRANPINVSWREIR